MNKKIKWLREQSKEWAGQGVVSVEQAERIQQLYPEPRAGVRWGPIIFSGIGAIIAGLGMMLLLACNWQAIPKAVKLGVMFFALIGSYGGGIRLYLGKDGGRQVGQAVCLLGSMFFGAGIWLVARIYHVQEHYPDGFLIWGLGALAMAWAMPSLAQGLLATAVLSIWGCIEGWEFNHALHGAPLVVLAGVGLLSWRLRSPLLLWFVLAAFFFTLVGNVQAVAEGLILRVLLNFAALFVALSILARWRRWFHESAPAWEFFGWLGFLLCVYLLSFPELVQGLMGLHHLNATSPRPMPVAYEWGTFVLALGAWAVLGLPVHPQTPREARPPGLRIEHWLVPLTALVCQAFVLEKSAGLKWEIAGVFNMVFLAVAAAWMARGCREGLFGPTVLGSLLLVALAVARYFDLLDSLAARGLVFLAVGGLFLAEGALFRRARSHAEGEEVFA
ncbi:MAG: DUF2157 domain-containing protein [Candidatus Omnitrophica bacterium]|nr:DUF2157 domain-containing protein [Candidatus Omnitrophota bacterium]